MLIHQQDYLMIDLERSKDQERRWDHQGDGFMLTFTLQVNGKLMRHKQRMYVYTSKQMNDIKKSNNNCNMPREDDWYIIWEYWPIYAVLDLLHDMWYNIKENEDDHSYRGIMPKLHEEINDYYNVD